MTVYFNILNVLCVLDCVVRMCEDEKASSKAVRYLIAALAVLPEENALNGKVVSSQALRAQFGPAVGLVTDSIPLHQQAWQVGTISYRYIYYASINSFFSLLLCCLHNNCLKFVIILSLVGSAVCVEGKH